MATQNVPNVNASLLNSTSTTAEVFEEQRREDRQRAQQKQAQGRDELTIYRKKLGVAGAAEPAAPKVKTTTSHERIKTAHTELKKAFVDAGGKGSKEADQNLDAVSVEQLEKVQNEIDKLMEQGASEKQIERLAAKRDALAGALEEFRAAHAEVENPTPTEGTETVATASVSETGTDSQPMSEEEQGLWKDLDAQLKLVGVERPEGETDVEAVQKRFMLKLGSEVSQLQTKEKGLTEKFNELHAKWKATTNPKEKSEIEKSLHEIKSVLTQIGQRKLDLQKLVTNFASTSDALLSYQVHKELGLNAAPEKPQTKTKSAKVQSASVSTGQSQKGGQGSQAGLSVQSAGGPTEGVSASAAGGEGPLLGTASEGGDSYVSPEVTLARTAANDFTGTSMSIASTSNNTRSEARRLDKLIKKLIMAAQSGNMEAVVSGLLFLGKRQNILTTSMGAQTLVAMQQYEKQLGVISNQIGALKPSPDYSSKLAKLNADMNIYSSSRQMITQTFRDFLNAKEQVEELGHSVIGKLGQLGSRLASFQ